mmetsp:Transcript_134492/g.335513  ORF Transcript_134492/g.335513 Transcript_134492/m.335513 type:complete len:282 (+) Transcript_134492:761-1606(+)
MFCWYSTLASVRSAVSVCWLVMHSLKLPSSLSIFAIKPVSGLLMRSSSSSIKPVRVVMDSWAAVMALFVSVRSLWHHAFWSLSALPSSSIILIIFSISSRTVAKGLLACNMATMLPRRVEPWPPTFSAAPCRKACAFCLVTVSAAAFASNPWWLATDATKRDGRCLRIWKNAGTASVEEVAFVVPKAANAASLLMMDKASARAASSCARNATRSSYCFFFAAHMSRRAARNSSASVFSASASASWERLADKSSSFPASSACFLLYAASISCQAFSMDAIYF